MFSRLPQNKVLIGFESILCAITGAYYLYVFFTGTFTPLLQMGPLVAVGLTMAFLTKPVSTELSPRTALIIDCSLAAISVAAVAYMIINESSLQLFSMAPTLFRICLSTVFFLLILEACRRILGWTMVVIVLFFFLYDLFGNFVPGMFWHASVPFTRLMVVASLSTEGVWGTPTYIGASIVVLFIMFASFLRVGGTAEFFLNLSQGFLGRYRGGPAKVAVVGSSLFGTISGSAIANAAAVGMITIPLMKRTGYKSHIAAAIEALASTGGGIMPPIMGSTAFIMANFIGVSYWTICVTAFVPSLLYYLSLFLIVDFEAGKTGLVGLPRNEVPDWKQVILHGGHLLIPVIILVLLLAVFNMSATTSALYALVSLWVVSFISKSTRLYPGKFYQALSGGIREMTLATVALATASVMMGLVFAANLGMQISNLMIDIAHGSLPILLILTAVVALILGMGMTIAAIYIILAILIGPALVQMGVPILAAHFFILYYANLNHITPPFCTACFVTAGIANAPPFKVGWSATYRGIITFILPFMFVYSPELIFQGDPLSIALALLTAIIGTSGLAIAIEGYAFVAEIRGLLHRLLFGLAGVIMIFPGWQFDLAGTMLMVLAAIPVYLSFRARKRTLPAFQA